jgi:hypothetical protein
MNNSYDITIAANITRDVPVRMIDNALKNCFMIALIQMSLLWYYNKDVYRLDVYNFNNFQPFYPKQTSLRIIMVLILSTGL